MTIPPIETLPESLRASVEQAWRDYLEACEAAGIAPLEQPRLLDTLPLVWAVSPFTAWECVRQPGILAPGQCGCLLRRLEPGEPRAELETLLAGVETEEALMRELRLYRQRHMVRIAWRDISGLAGLEETCGDLSELADAVVDLVLTWLIRDMEPAVGRPFDRQGHEQSFVVIAMGKLGARELNYSSDIDLVFVHTGEGETRGGHRTLSNSEYFARLGKRLIGILGTVTAEGFVFRVDMRLRPFGDSGPLVVSEEAVLAYYEAHARDWERYALIKGRACAGDIAAGERLLAALQPFVYRRYIDYTVLDSLREMKQMIDREVARKGLADDIKLGPGGIREIEFMAQIFQLIRGGAEPSLRRRALLEVLPALADLGLMPQEVVESLIGAYRFLRNTEHRIQQIADRQTQRLPQEETERLRVALGMGHDGWEPFLQALDRHRARVSEQFALLLRSPEQEAGEELQAGRQVLDTLEDPPTATRLLEMLGFSRPGEARAALLRLQETRPIRRMDATGRARLERLLPRLIELAAECDDPDLALERVLPLIGAIARRSVYLALLSENLPALARLLRLCEASSFVATRITRQPLLLDELLHPETLYHPPDRQQLQRELTARLYKCPRGDLEAYMEALRQFKQAQVLRVAAADLTGRLPVPEVSNHLSDIAEVVVEMALTLAWEQLRERHGNPRYEIDGQQHQAGFAVVAYGKLGGLELGYASDLDLVFLHDSRGARQQTDGPRPLDNATFFTRLAQRTIHLLSTTTPSGRCYEVDTRLRPSGASGLLVTSLEAFARYQREQAWTWEHQALVRARTVAGEAAVREGFDLIRREVLARRREPDRLRREVVRMREKMRARLDRSDQDTFDLKQGVGGITDIEFMVQYAVLRWACDHPGLLDWSDNLRLLERMSEYGLLPEEERTRLTQAYFAMRGEVHRLALQERKGLVEADRFLEHRHHVIAVWRRLMQPEQVRREPT